MNPDTFRLLIFEMLEHHLEMVEESYNADDISYHIERCRWATAYLQRYTIHIEPTEQMIVERLEQ